MSEASLASGVLALETGRWQEARAEFETALADAETAEASFGLGSALWWLGENHASVVHGTRAYALFRRAGNIERAVQCAVWLGITYKANFASFAVANGWIGRAERLVETLEPGPLHGWVHLARAYRMPDLDAAEALTVRALDLARAAVDVDLELSALAQLGLIRVGKGQVGEGFALIDEATAAALGGERSSLDTVVYTCCDMLNACELASDVERAAQWCRVADDFVAAYGCPFLYAECRIYYGSVLSVTGRWDEAARELTTALRITAGACPGLHAKALTRLANLRVRQGRLEEAEGLLSDLDETVEAEAEATLSSAALLLARGDSRGVSRKLEERLHHLPDHRQLAAGLDMLIDACIDTGDLNAARVAAEQMTALSGSADSRELDAWAASARGRLAMANDAADIAATELRTALTLWSEAEHPFEVARTRYELGRVVTLTTPEVAVDQLRRSLATFEALGATLEADRVAAYLRSLGISARTGAKGVGLLTGREQQVLRLLAAGLSNPEIADRLHVSRKTASHHVSHILTKLNLRNRAEAVAYAVADRFGHAS